MDGEHGTYRVVEVDGQFEPQMNWCGVWWPLNQRGYWTLPMRSGAILSWRGDQAAADLAIERARCINTALATRDRTPAPEGE